MRAHKAIIVNELSEIHNEALEASREAKRAIEDAPEDAPEDALEAERERDRLAFSRFLDALWRRG
jgi:hypothetical protein